MRAVGGTHMRSVVSSFALAVLLVQTNRVGEARSCYSPHVETDSPGFAFQDPDLMTELQALIQLLRKHGVHQDAALLERLRLSWSCGAPGVLSAA